MSYKSELQDNNEALLDILDDSVLFPANMTTGLSDIGILYSSII